MSPGSLRGQGIVPDRAAFRVLARDADLVPVYREIPFDVETAVRCYAKLARPPFGFLLESVVGGEKWARYSFLGSGALGAWRLRDGRQETWSPREGWKPAGATSDPLAALLAAMPGERVATPPGLPRFWGGAVGFFGYDTARFFERLPAGPPRAVDVPDAVMIFTDVVLAVDKLRDRALVIAPALPRRMSPDEAYEDAVARIDSVLAGLRSQASVGHLAIDLTAPDPSWISTYEQAGFEHDVERIRDYIHAGDAFQVVLSQRLTTELRTSPFTVYRALRMMNPSPYLFFLDLDGLQLVGSSPEAMVRVEADRATVRPIAGTRPRGRSEDEDLRLEHELRADAKERAEHLMLVDLGRNDVGRVTRYGSVVVSEFMNVERYSHVMHLVSQVEGVLRDGLTPLDAFRAAFPAGTVSGAPKIRAMEIIDELEPVRRGPYAGAVGYLAYDRRTLDTAIAIRTLLVESGRAHVQAGAGIVADSDPRREYNETLGKAQALLRALAVTAGGSS
jgi:anthranilate synthase component 1